MTVEGIDVSKHQPSTPPLAGLGFLFARASIGLTADAVYPLHIANARAAGLVTGAYHFNWSPVSPSQQADFFLARAVGADLLVIDVEANVYNGVTTPAFSIAQTQEFIARVHAVGRKIGLYHSQSGFFNAGQDYNWIAKWSSTPPAGSWAFWQYQGSPLDLDRYNGTLEQLRAFAGAAPPPPPQPKWAFDHLERLAEGTHFATTRNVNVWDPNRPGKPVATLLPTSVLVTWRLGIVWTDYGAVRPVPNGYPFVQIAEGPFLNCVLVEADGVVVPPEPPVPPPAEQPPLPLPPFPSKPRSTRLPGGIEII